MNARRIVFAALAAALCLGAPASASTLSEKVYRVISEIYELREANRNEDALQQTESLLRRSLSDYERSQALLLQADLLISLERYEAAIVPMEGSLKTGAEMPQARLDQIRYNLGQLYSQVGRYREAVKVLEAWIRQAENVPANAYFVLAACHLELNALRAARQYADQGRALSKSLTYSQYQFLGSIYIQQSDWPAMEGLLVEGIQAYPDKAGFWTQLAQVHMERKQETKALSVMRLAYAHGVLIQGSDLVRMAQLMRLRDAPWLAAHVMEEGLKRKAIESTSSNWLLLGNSWVAAREYQRAYAPLTRAAELTKKSRDWLRLARLYARNAGWGGCLKSVDAGLRVKPDDPGPFQLLRGICSYEEGERARALEAFALAAKSRKSSAEAKGWINFIKSL